MARSPAEPAAGHAARRPRSDHLRGDPPPAVGDQRRPGADGGAALGLVHRLRGLRLQRGARDGRRARALLRDVHPPARRDDRRVRPPHPRGVAGRGDPRGRHVLHQRSLVGGAARQRRDPRDADLLGGRAGRRGRGSRCTTRTSAARCPGSFVAGAARPLRRGAALPRRSRWSTASRRGRRAARLPAQQPHLGAQRAQHARARRRPAHDLPSGSRS